MYLGVIWLSGLHKTFLDIMDFAKAQTSPMENSAGCNFIVSGMKCDGLISPKPGAFLKVIKTTKKRKTVHYLLIICYMLNYYFWPKLHFVW